MVLPGKKKELILAHQFMRVKESRQLSVCVCVSVICFSLKFHVSVRRNWIQRWFPHCVSAVRRATVSYYPVHVTRDDTQQQLFPGIEGGVHSYLRAAHLQCTRFCTGMYLPQCFGHQTKEEEPRKPACRLPVVFSIREVRLVSTNHRSPQDHRSVSLPPIASPD